MKKDKFEKMKIQAEVYAQEATEARLNFFTAYALDEYEIEEWPVDYDYMVGFPQAEAHAAATLKHRGYELQTFFDCFFIKYYDGELYYEGKFNPRTTKAFTDPAYQYGLTKSQVQEIRDIIEVNVKKSFDRFYIGDKETYKECLEHFEMRDKAIDNLLK